MAEDTVWFLMSHQSGLSPGGCPRSSSAVTSPRGEPRGQQPAQGTGGGAGVQQGTAIQGGKATMTICLLLGLAGPSGLVLVSAGTASSVRSTRHPACSNREASPSTTGWTGGPELGQRYPVTLL